MRLEPVIGIEIHIQLNTKTKMFSGASYGFNAEPNTRVSPYDVAYPGTMPQVNKEAVKKAVRFAHILHMEIENILVFDRKNYFYSDLPKGYQITQQARPLGKNGYIEISINGNAKRINIERLHIEEDTCAQHHLENITLIDFNRAGVPLVEIVSKPEIRSGKEAKEFCKKIRELAVFSNISNGKMQEGSLRCDVNVSIKENSSSKLGTKVEIKNLNSFEDIEKAINYEIERQTKLLNNGSKVIQETRRFDEKQQLTVSLRNKEDVLDYKYFTEPNILPIRLSEEFIKEAIESCPELYEDKLNRFERNYGLSEYEAKVILNIDGLAAYFEKCCIYSKNYKGLSSFFINDFISFIRKENRAIDDVQIEPKLVANLIDSAISGQINKNQMKSIFKSMISSDYPSKFDLNDAISSINNKTMNTEEVVDIVVQRNLLQIEEYKNGKKQIFNYLVGQIIKEADGKIDIEQAKKLLLEKIKSF